MPGTKRPLGALIALLGVIIAMLAIAGPANAEGYSNSAATSVSDQTPAAGSSLKFCGTGFQPGESVSIKLDNGTTYPSVVADSAGDFCTVIVLGASLTGSHTITATGATSHATSSTTVKVAGVSAKANPQAAAGSTGGLAFTGAAVISIGTLAALLLLGGAVMVLSSRRRKTVP